MARKFKKGAMPVRSRKKCKAILLSGKHCPRPGSSQGGLCVAHAREAVDRDRFDLRSGLRVGIEIPQRDRFEFVGQEDELAKMAVQQGASNA